VSAKQKPPAPLKPMEVQSAQDRRPGGLIGQNTHAANMTSVALVDMDTSQTMVGSFPLSSACNRTSRQPSQMDLTFAHSWEERSARGHGPQGSHFSGADMELTRVVRESDNFRHPNTIQEIGRQSVEINLTCAECVGMDMTRCSDLKGRTVDPPPLPMSDRRGPFEETSCRANPTGRLVTKLTF